MDDELKSLHDNNTWDLIKKPAGQGQSNVVKFGMSNSKPVVTPTNPLFKLSMSQNPSTKVERAYMNRIPYASLIGSLMYVMVYMRSSIAYKVSLVSRYMEIPRKAY